MTSPVTVIRRNTKRVLAALLVICTVSGAMETASTSARVTLHRSGGTVLFWLAAISVSSVNALTLLVGYKEEYVAPQTFVPLSLKAVAFLRGTSGGRGPQNLGLPPGCPPPLCIHLAYNVPYATGV